MLLGDLCYLLKLLLGDLCYLLVGDLCEYVSTVSEVLLCGITLCSYNKLGIVL